MAAEMFLSAVISLLTNKAADLVLGEFRTARSVEKDCQKLYRILPAVQSVVEDAEERSRAEPAVREWVHSLKAAAHEAEDVLDELKYDAIRKAIETEMKSKRKVPLSLLGCSVFKNNIFRSSSDGKRLKGVLERIDALVAEMNQFGFMRTLQPVPAVVSRPRTHSYVVESTVIGRNNDLENIVAIVVSQAEREKFTVLPIVGMGGLGKTTLAQLVYNSSVIQPHFEQKLWVCVSDEFDVARIAKAIIDVAVGGNSNLPLDNMEVIQQRLREVLCKRYLLVLDDVWNENPSKWDQLKILLECGNTTGVVIVTTRSEKVAMIVGTVGAYNLQGLDEHHLWAIFTLKAFPMGTDEQPELVEIGKQLMKKCCGSPLVATTLGGLMSYKKEKREWLDVLESKNLIVENEIMPVLKLSYENLPSYMKRCFTFCAVYPKDYEMERDTLIQLWMANSHIPSDENTEIEAKGIEIFNELAWRGLFQDVKKELDGTISCKMHDLIHDLARSLVGKTCVSFSNPDPRSVVLSKETIHVVYSNIKDTCRSLIESSIESSVHSLLIIDNIFVHNGVTIPLDLSKARSCRALILRDIPIEEIHVEPKSLKHLRCLDFSYCSWLKVLPVSLCTLYNLQTLKLTECVNLKNLPKNMSHMRSLRHLYLDGCDLERMPAAMGKLRNLQTLTYYKVDPAIGCGIEELKDLNVRGTLIIYGLEKLGNQQEAKLANLTSKTNLIELQFVWPDHSVDHTLARDILEGLEPYRGLEVLRIMEYDGIEFAKWMYDSPVLRNLTQLSLLWCKQVTTLPPLWQLPSLKELDLVGLDSLEHICGGNALLAQDQASHNKFPTLQKLIMADLISLERWQENDPMEQTSLTLPQIRTLIIRNCDKLDVLPFCPLIEILALNHLDNLKKICSGGSTQLVPMCPMLRELHLSNLSSLERWQENDPAEHTSLALPQLHSLRIWNCPRLNALPSCPMLGVLRITERTNIPSSVIESFKNKGIKVFLD